MSTVPGYHDQPSTLDDRIVIPDDAPQAMGHLSRPGLAAEVADASAESTKDKAKKKK